MSARAAAIGARPRVTVTHQRILALFVIAEVVVFSVIGSNFLTVENAGEIIRAAAEIGLLSLALTPVILTGGIDLSCGSLLGLAAVAFGATEQASGSVGAAALAAVGVGLAGGALNALFVARLNIPPLIVTLGTYSLFRGLAEGFTGGVKNYSNVPHAFLFLGQGFFGPFPAQALVLVCAALGLWWLVERMVFGRVIRAIGFSLDASRHAGLRVGRSIGAVYGLSGATAGVAALLYVARLGQAKADAGTGFELTAITAVVLGGTSIFGGRGSIAGTLLGVAALAILQDGLRLADLPTELAGIGAAVLLIAALGANRLYRERTT